MLDSFLRSLSSSSSSSNGPWPARIRANFHELFRRAGPYASSANGAPIHLLETMSSPRASRAQGLSFLTHVVLIMSLAALAAQSSRHGGPMLQHRDVLPTPPRYPAHFLENRSIEDAKLGQGKGEGHDSTPARLGVPPPPSAIQLVKPSIPPPKDPSLPVPPTLLDPNANPVLVAVNHIGMPRGPDTNSSGPGRGPSIGNRPGDEIGVGDREGPGVSNELGPYRVAATQPTCLYCPTPLYTDEARQSKLQGMVTLLVLVGADGRPADLRVAKGIGFSLDERAIEAVRGWRFAPARDSARRPVATWVTIEVVFRLF